MLSGYHVSLSLLVGYPYLLSVLYHFDIYSEWSNKAQHNGKQVFPLNHSENPKVGEPRELVKARMYMA